jgi:rubrerythrin
MLLTAGFTEVYSMEGGIHAWEGLLATGEPEAGMAWFPEAVSGADLISLAWILEDGSRRFYSELPSRVNDPDAGALFGQLVLAEEQHQSALSALYRKTTDAAAGPPARSGEDVMEGGVKVSEALAWIKDRSVTDVLELAVGLETNSYDLYIKMGRKMIDEPSREVFSMLASGERVHLDRLVGLLDKKL